MARTYRVVDREQEFLLPPSMNEWLPEDHLVWFVIAAVQRLDTAGFHARARLGGVGRRGYDPDMLLTLFVYAMAHGERSSRQIERLCETDVAFRIICAGDVPDHTVLARFRKDHQQGLEELLTHTLVLCAELGMVRLGVLAFDGTKIAANAARDATFTEEHLRRLAEQFVTDVADTDEAEDGLFGEDVRGDEVPESVRDRGGRASRIGQALAQIDRRRAARQQGAGRQQQAAQAYEQAMTEDRVRTGRPPNGTDPVRRARATWERQRRRAEPRFAAWTQRAEQAQREGRRPSGPRVGGPDDYAWVRRARAAYDAALAAAAASAAEADKPADKAEQDKAEQDKAEQDKANLTDPDSRLMKTRNGWIQGYNCQTAVSEDGFILTARATQDTNDMRQFVPTMQAVTELAERLRTHTGRTDLGVGTMIGDAGYDSDDNLTADGPDRLIADTKRRPLDKRAAAEPAVGPAPAEATARQRMNHRLRTEQGHALYTRRAAIVEPANAWLKDGRRLRRFARRGLQAVQSELAFASAVTNLLKLTAHGITTTELADRSPR